MKKLSILLACLVLALCLCAMQSFAQKKPQIVGEIRVEIKDFGKSGESHFFDVPIYDKEFPTNRKEGFYSEGTETKCDFRLDMKAIEISQGKAVITFYIQTQDSKKNALFKKSLKLEMNEKKSFKLETRLKCFTQKYYLINAFYEKVYFRLETQNKAK